MKGIRIKTNASPRLSFRYTDAAELYIGAPPGIPRGNLFAVRIVPVGFNGIGNKCLMSLPGMSVGNCTHPHCDSLAIVAMEESEDGWVWAEIDADTKEMIGNFLTEKGVEVGWWVYLDVFCERYKRDD